jgi:hypothetical protein
MAPCWPIRPACAFRSFFRFSFFIFVFIFDLQGERGKPRLSNKQHRGAMEWQTGELFPFFFFFLFDL